MTTAIFWKDSHDDVGVFFVVDFFSVKWKPFCILSVDQFFGMKKMVAMLRVCVVQNWYRSDRGFLNLELSP